MTDAALLADAERALHELLTGARAASFTDQSGERVEYQSAHSGRLQSYVTGLRARVAGRAPRRVFTLRTSKGLT